MMKLSVVAKLGSDNRIEWQWNETMTSLWSSHPTNIHLFFNVRLLPDLRCICFIKGRFTRALCRVSTCKLRFHGHPSIMQFHIMQLHSLSGRNVSWKHMERSCGVVKLKKSGMVHMHKSSVEKSIVYVRSCAKLFPCSPNRCLDQSRVIRIGHDGCRTLDALRNAVARAAVQM